MNHTKYNIPNFHTHSSYCDGKDVLEAFVAAAIAKNQPAIGFSGHAPVPFDSWWNMTSENFSKYLSEICELKAKYQNQIEIYTGIEADYLKNTVSPSDFAELNLDFCIGSIHYLQPKRAELPWDFIISPKVFQEGLNDFYDNDIHALIRDYFQANCEMIEAGGINIIGHCDQIRKFNKGNRFFEESDPIYQKYLHEMFDLIAEKKIIVEINTRGKLKHLTQNFFPSNSSLKICKDKGIRIMLSADAHKPDECNSYLTEAAQTALNSGFTKISIIENGKIIEHNIKEFANVLV